MVGSMGNLIRGQLDPFSGRVNNEQDGEDPKQLMTKSVVRSICYKFHEICHRGNPSLV